MSETRAESMHAVEIIDPSAALSVTLNPPLAAAVREWNPWKAATEKGRKETTHCDYSFEFKRLAKNTFQY